MTLVAVVDSPCFQEVAEHFAETLGCEIAVGGTSSPSEDDTYIIFTAHEPPDIQFGSYIVYNMEQLPNLDPVPPFFYDRLRAAKEVWDYSLVNIRFLEEKGVRGAKHVPYLPFLHLKPKPIDNPRGVVFLGAANPRRRAFLDGLPGLRWAEAGCWGADREAAYAAASVGVNVHFFGGPETSILEVHRIAPMLRAGLTVVSERSCDAFYDDLLERAGVVFVDGEEDFRRTVHSLVTCSGRPARAST